MNLSEDPSLGELERRGHIDHELALLYGRVLGGNWRNSRLSDAAQAVVQERRRLEAREYHPA